MSSNFKKVTRGEGFSKDLKQLLKKYRSLEEDLEVFVKAQLYAYHKLQADNNGIFPIDNLGFESPKMYKARKFACKALKGKGARSGIRVIYTYLPEFDEIYLLEIYSKSDKENEDRDRIKNFALTLSNVSQA
jgi:mRNA-degrading endonuclease RelE of RelBE toxin-antitoxin system